MAINYTTLKTEIQTDPAGAGYGPYVSLGNDMAVANLINAPSGNITVRRSSITNKEIVEAIDVTDYAAIPSNPTNTQLSVERRYLSWFEGIMGVDSIRLLNDDGTNTPVVANFMAMFPSGTPTRTRLFTLASRTGSRAEQLFGTDVTVTPTDISYALRGTK
jgi:hypothetical protein